MTLEDRIMAATLRKCRGQIARPLGVDPSAVTAARERGFLVFHEWPSGHYQITDKGRNFLADLEEI